MELYSILLRSNYSIWTFQHQVWSDIHLFGNTALIPKTSSTIFYIRFFFSCISYFHSFLFIHNVIKDLIYLCVWFMYMYVYVYALFMYMYVKECKAKLFWPTCNVITVYSRTYGPPQLWLFFHFLSNLDSVNNIQILKMRFSLKHQIYGTGSLKKFRIGTCMTYIISNFLL